MEPLDHPSLDFNKGKWSVWGGGGVGKGGMVDQTPASTPSTDIIGIGNAF